MSATQTFEEAIAHNIKIIEPSGGDDSAGAMHVIVDAATTPTSKTDDAAFTPGTDPVSMAGFTFDDVSPDTVNEGDAGAGRMSANRNQYVQIRDNAGNERGLNIDANGNIGTTDKGPGWTSAHGIAGVPFTSADATTAANATSVPTAGQKLVITDVIISSDTELSVTLRCETTDVVIAGPFYMAAGSTIQVTPRSKAWKLATADKRLQAIASDAGNVMVDAHYFSEA